MSVEMVSEVTEELVTAMEGLLPQLSRSAPALSHEQLREIVTQDGVYFFVYRDPETERILGSLTLATFKIPTGLRAWIEDVVVDADARGQGAGQKLVEAALAEAKKQGCRTVDLTSRPTREAANRLYQRCGFSPRETNVYRYTFTD